MSQSIDATGLLESQPTPAPDRVPVLSGVLAVFILGAVTVSPLEGWDYLVKGIGVALAAAFLITSIRAPAGISAEVILFIAWLTWAMTGVYVAPIGLLFWEKWTTCFQIWVLLVIVAGFTGNRKMLSLNLAAFVLGVFITGFYSYITGEYQRAEAGGTRVTGLAMNPNAFAWLMFLAVTALAYFWVVPSRSKKLKYVFLGGGLMAAGAGIIASGSRKAMVGVAVFFAAWLWFCYRHRIKREPLFAIALIVALIGTAIVAFGYMESTGALARFELAERAWSGRLQVSESTVLRIQLLKEAWDTLLKYPLTGVGLGNFVMFSRRHLFTHNEYAEIAVTTGVPGFFIYFGIFYFLWRRTCQIRKHTDDPATMQITGVIKAFIVAVMVMNMGRWNFQDKAAWVIFGSFIGYTASTWNALRARLPQVPGRAAA